VSTTVPFPSFPALSRAPLSPSVKTYMVELGKLAASGPCPGEHEPLERAAWQGNVGRLEHLWTTLTADEREDVTTHLDAMVTIARAMAAYVQDLRFSPVKIP
jgi:hypothetical protein